MKKTLFIVCIIAIIICVFSVNAAAANSEFLLGDIDCNDEIDPADARLVLRLAVKLESFPDDVVQSADIDGNGVVDPADARIVLRVAVGLENIIDYYSEEIYEIYHDVFEMYKKGFKNDFYVDTHFETYYKNEYHQDDPYDKMGRYPNPLSIESGRWWKSDLCFTFIDFSMDGMPELLIATGTDLLDAFGYENGVVYRLFDAEAMRIRSRYYVYKDGMIVNYASGGAGYHAIIIYSLPMNSTTPKVEYDIRIEGTKNGDQYSLVEDETVFIISEQKYNDIISQYSENNSVQWKVLCEKPKS